jgi:hypothetical protein
MIIIIRVDVYNRKMSDKSEKYEMHKELDNIEQIEQFRHEIAAKSRLSGNEDPEIFFTIRHENER